MVAKTVRELINFWDGWQCGAYGEEFQSQGELISHRYQYHGGMQSKPTVFSQKLFFGTGGSVEHAEIPHASFRLILPLLKLSQRKLFKIQGIFDGGSGENRNTMRMRKL